MTRVVGAAYAALIALAVWQSVLGRAQLDAPVTFAVAALVVVAVARTSLPTHAVVKAVAVVGSAVSVWTLVVFVIAVVRHGGEPSSFYAVKVAVVTPIAPHNILASVLLVTMVAAAVAAGDDRRWLGALTLITLALGATLSRGAVLVGVGTALATWLVLAQRRLAARLGAASLVSMALVLTAALVLDASVPGGDGPTSVVARSQLWAAGWHALVTHPLTGVGFDGFRASAAAFGVADPRDHAHNLFLHAGATGGAVALAAVVALWGSLAVAAWRRAQDQVRTFVLPAGAALLTHGLIEETAFRPAIAVTFAVLLGLVLRPEDQNTPRTARAGWMRAARSAG